MMTVLPWGINFSATAMDYALREIVLKTKTVEAPATVAPVIKNATYALIYASPAMRITSVQPTLNPSATAWF